MEFLVDKHLTCICVLCIKPHLDMLSFLERMNKHIGKNKLYDIYLLCDDNTQSYAKYSKDIQIIQVDENVCKENGYINANYCIPKTPSAWDKALYFFKHRNIYDRYWFLEEDVFVPNIDTIRQIDIKYPDGDLLTSANMKKIKDESIMWSHTIDWKHMLKKDGSYFFDSPWYASMSCVVRMSKDLINEINIFAQKEGTLCFLEFFFNTLAMKKKLKIVVVKELKYIVFRHDWTIESIDEKYMYHPIKDISKQKMFRKILIGKDL
jgi:hypothetical protein